jgi:hypothetical protein
MPNEIQGVQNAVKILDSVFPPDSLNTVLTNCIKNGYTGYGNNLSSHKQQHTAELGCQALYVLVGGNAMLSEAVNTFAEQIEQQRNKAGQALQQSPR